MSRLAALLALLWMLAGCGDADADADADTAGGVDALAGQDAVADVIPLDTPETPADTLPETTVADIGEDVPPVPSAWESYALGAGERDILETWCHESGLCLAVGAEGLLLRSVGTGWISLPSDVTTTLHGVYGFDATSAVVVGDEAVVLRVAGAEVEPLCGPDCTALLPSAEISFRAVWGESAEHFFVAGDDGIVLVYDAGVWSHEPTGISSAIHALWGTEASDLYAAGARGKVLHRSATTWVAREILTSTATIHDLWGSGPGDVVAVGTGGKVVRLTDGQWVTTATGDLLDRDLFGVWGRSADDILAVGAGGVVLEWDGDRWDLVDVAGPVFRNRDLHAVASPDGHVVLLGAQGAALIESSGELVDTSAGLDQTLYGVWSSADGRDIIAVGEDGIVLEGPLPGAVPVALRSVSPGHTWRAVHGNAAGHVRAVGDGGFTLSLDTGEVEEVAAAGGVTLRGVWVGPGMNAVAVGELGTVVVHDEAGWTLGAAVGVADLTAVAGSGVDDLWIAAADGRLFHGGTAEGFQEVARPVLGALEALWVSDTGRVWAAGDAGIVVTGDLSGFSRVYEAPGSFLYGLTGTSGVDPGVVAVGWSGLALLGTGDEWGTDVTGTFVELRAAAAWSGGVVAVGRAGAYLRRAPLP